MGRYLVGWVLGVVFGLGVGSCTARAQALHALSARDLSMEYYRIGNNRDAYYPIQDPGNNRGEYWTYGTALHWDVDMLRWGDYGVHWRNAVRGNASESQFRSVEWDFRWGLNLGPKLELFYDHTSAHLLDESPDKPRSYRLKNFYGAEAVFYRRDK